ncbi:hypothetical protein RvY_11573 [Ramazzottius varieornatus]|uniref:Uncharacterized protein n=1 Tax=Ramazzottius varieornatus TaxID=947166 RepID=A0A1D1VGL7_RAMVA|nr:hypothetical protein RvY_11573 [Ramazzottius varieornatus]
MSYTDEEEVSLWPRTKNLRSARCDRKVYIHLKECQQLEETTRSGIELPILCSDHFCLQKVALYGYTRREH